MRRRRIGWNSVEWKSKSPLKRIALSKPPTRRRSTFLDRWKCTRVMLSWKLWILYFKSTVSFSPIPHRFSHSYFWKGSSLRAEWEETITSKGRYEKSILFEVKWEKTLRYEKQGWNRDSGARVSFFSPPTRAFISLSLSLSKFRLRSDPSLEKEKGRKNEKDAWGRERETHSHTGILFRLGGKSRNVAYFVKFGITAKLEMKGNAIIILWSAQNWPIQYSRG